MPADAITPRDWLRAAAVDEAPEIGQTQAAAWDPSVTEALEAQGIDVREVHGLELTNREETTAP